MTISNKTVWVIMSKDRKVIGKGTPRNRELVFVDDEKDKKRYLTYSSKGMAESGFKYSFFSQWKIKQVTGKEYEMDDLEAVECNLIMSVCI